MHANDLFKKCYQKKPVREWEQQERKAEEARQTCNLRQLDLTAELWVQVMLQLCQTTRELGLTYANSAQQLTKGYPRRCQFQGKASNSLRAFLKPETTNPKSSGRNYTLKTRGVCVWGGQEQMTGRNPWHCCHLLYKTLMTTIAEWPW